MERHARTTGTPAGVVRPARWAEPLCSDRLVETAPRNGDDVTEYARTHCLRGTTLLFDNIGELDSRTRYAGGKIDPKHTFIGQRVGGLFGMQKVVAHHLVAACDAMHVL